MLIYRYTLAIRYLATGEVCETCYRDAIGDLGACSPRKF